MPRRAAMGFILVTVLLDMIGFGVAFPTLPVLLGEYTATPADQVRWFGVLAAVYGLCQFLAAPVLGALSDAWGRRPVLLGALVLLLTHYVLLLTAASIPALVAARALGGVAGASFSVASAYASDVTAPASRARSFGLLGAAFGLGFILGPALGGLLGEFDPRLPFLVAAGLAGANLLYGVVVLPESHPPDRRRAFDLRRANALANLVGLRTTRGAGGILPVFTLYALAHAMMVETWVVYTINRYGWTPRQNGFALALVGAVAVAIGAGGLGVLVRRFGERRLARLGLASATVGFVAWGLAPWGWMVYATTIATALMHATTPSLKAIVSKAADPALQGATMGSFDAIYSLMAVLGPPVGTQLLGGVVARGGSGAALGIVFFVGAALNAVAWLLFTRAPIAASAPVPAAERG